MSDVAILHRIERFMREKVIYLIYFASILALVGGLFLINFGCCDNLSSLFSFGPASFKTKSSDFWFSMFTESIIVFVTFLVVVIFIKQGEEKDRKPVYKEACEDACQIYDEIYKLIYHIMVRKMNIEMLKPYEAWLESDATMESKITTYEIVKAFFEDICVSNITVDRKELERRIDYIYSEIENYLQRFSAFLTSEATGNEGSELQKYFNNMRRFSRQLKRSIDSQRSDELLLKVSRNERQYKYVILINDSERIDIPLPITQNMKNCHTIADMEHRHTELVDFVKKAGKGIDKKWMEILKFSTTVYFIEELIKHRKIYDSKSGNIDRDDCILTWTVLFGLFEKFRKSGKLSGASEATFDSAEFDFWRMYWDYRHRHLEDAKKKCKKNTLDFCLDNPQDSQSGPKDLAKAVRKERERQCRLPQNDQRQDCGQATSELKEMFKVLDVRKNDEKAIEVFDRMTGDSDDGHK